MATAAAAGDVVERRVVAKRPSLVLKPLSDCKDLPLLQRRASKGRPPAGFVNTDADTAADRLSDYDSVDVDGLCQPTV